MYNRDTFLNNIDEYLQSFAVNVNEIMMGHLTARVGNVIKIAGVIEGLV